MPKFRILEGRHSDGVRASDGKFIVYNKGETFESVHELDKKFNTGVSKKFERLPDDARVTHPLNAVAQAAKAGFDTIYETPPQENTPVFTADELNVMTVEELKRLAAEEEVSIDGLTKKADIVAKIQESISA